MDLVERYLNAIRPLLPGDMKDDIIAELGDEIRSRIEEKEVELGRKLKPAEIEAILKAMGAPLSVAARYGPGRHLIGPAVYPIYVLAIKAVLTVIVLAEIIGFAVKTALGFARGQPGLLAERLGQTFGDLLSTALFMVGLITVIAAVVERTNPNLQFDNWAPSRLPHGAGVHLGHRPSNWPSRRLRRRRPSRIEGAFGLVLNLIFFLWLLGYVEAPGAYPAYLSPEHWLEAGTRLSLAPVWWERLFAWTLAGLAGRIVLNGVMLADPSSRRGLAAARLLCDVIGIGFAIAVVQASAVFAAAPGYAANAQVDEVLQTLNAMLRLAFGVVGVILAFDALFQLWRLAGPAPRSVPA